MSSDDKEQHLRPPHYPTLNTTSLPSHPPRLSRFGPPRSDWIGLDRIGFELSLGLVHRSASRSLRELSRLAAHTSTRERVVTPPSLWVSGFMVYSSVIVKGDRAQHKQWIVRTENNWALAGRGRRSSTLRPSNEIEPLDISVPF